MFSHVALLDLGLPELLLLGPLLPLILVLFLLATPQGRLLLKNRTLVRTFQFIVLIVLLFSGPAGWACDYLLYKQWNPESKGKR